MILRRLITPLVVGSAFMAIAWAETRRPLRKQRESRLLRTGRNLAMASMSAAAATVLQAPILFPIAEAVERRRIGLLYRIPMPKPLRRTLAVLALDYTLWWWHYINHKVPFFWRFHLVHHVDRDLDSSTALRFHFGEMSLSVLVRSAQVALIGCDRTALSIWQMLLLVSIIFHHSNLELPPELERRLSRIVVTPRMHGIHHSDYQRETDSNWSSLLSVWDFLHGTFREDIPQQSIQIGVPAYQRPEDVTLDKITLMPFAEQREDWRALDGTLQVERKALSS